MAPSRFSFRKVGRALQSRRAGFAATLVLLAAVLYKAFTGTISFFSADSGVSQFPELSGVNLPHYSVLTPSFLHSIWPLMLMATILVLAAWRLSRTLAKARANSAAAPVDDQSGSTAVEFVMILPALAVILLMILQIALIVQAKFVVNYAAFCAARSAIVIIPDDFPGGEARNHLNSPDSSEKFQVIHRGAALPLTAISPLPGTNLTRGVPILTDPNVVAELFKLAPFDVAPRSMMAQVMLRAPYAYHPENTAIKVLTQQGAESGSFDEHDWVTVKVNYRYYLAVPFAKKLFGTAYSGNPFATIIFGTDYYYSIVEQYTLPMDGEPSGL